MYTELKVYQIVIALLKQYGIKRCVLSAGTRNVPFVHSVEEDSYFDCYSVVDERSAGYFAMGLAQELHEPVVISCTSSTAACNYYPPVAEAFYQKVPVLVLTSDRDPARLHQWEDQMIDQVGMFDRHVIKSVNLPIIHSADDEIWCRRLINEALSALYHNGGGPVQINVPMLRYNSSFTVKELPAVSKIERLCHETPGAEWDRYAEKLKKANRILITPGQKSYVSDELKKALEAFFRSYNVAVSVDYMANIDTDFAVNTTLCWDRLNVSRKKFSEFLPDIVISFGGNIFQSVKELLTVFHGRFEHWLIQPDGEMIDTYMCLNAVFECTPEYFFKYYAARADGNKNDMAYHTLIKEYADAVRLPEFAWCNVYAINRMVERIPSGSVLHMAINGAIRITNYSRLQKGIKVYANIGTHGIDGCLSSFLGQASARKELSYLVIGDLAFFYDMNALRIRHIKNNVRILLINNHGGEEFYYNKVWQNERSDLHTTARHNTKAEGWVKEVGFKYLSANDKESFGKALEEFMAPDSDKPVLLEVFTEMSTDAKALHDYYESRREGSEKIYQNAKQFAKRVIGQEKAMKIVSLLKK